MLYWGGGEFVTKNDFKLQSSYQLRISLNFLYKKSKKIAFKTDFWLKNKLLNLRVCVVKFTKVILYLVKKMVLNANIIICLIKIEIQVLKNITQPLEFEIKYIFWLRFGFGECCDYWLLKVKNSCCVSREFLTYNAF